MNLLESYLNGTLNMAAEELAEHLFVRPKHSDDSDMNRLESDMIFKSYADIKLVVYLRLKEEGGALDSTILRKSLFSEQLTEEQSRLFYDVAFENTIKSAPAALYKNIFDIENSANLLQTADYYGIKENNTLLLTTERKTNGAISVFYPGVLKKVSDIFGTDLFIAFTSIHEAMIHSVGSIDARSIQRNVQETNRVFGPDDTLSNCVFRYFREAGKLALVEIKEVA